MTKVRTLVFGYGALGAAAMETLTSAGGQVIGLVVPSNRAGPDIDVVRSSAASRGIPVLVQPPRAEVQGFATDLQIAAPDLIVVWSYSMILPPAILAMPRLGCVNVHGGLLPWYRGGHVMQWALINGEVETGVTLHYMDAGIDSGPIIVEARFPIEWDDDATSVRRKLKETGMRLLREWLPAIAAGTAPRIPQDESVAKRYPLRTPDDGLISWNSSVVSIYNLVRALVAPWPGAFTSLRGRRIIVRKVRVVRGSPARSAPGVVSEVDEGGIRVSAGDGEILILQAEADGVVVGPEDWRILDVSVGDRFDT